MKTKGAGTTFQPSSVLEPDSNPPVLTIALSPALLDCTSMSSITLKNQITPVLVDPITNTYIDPSTLAH